MSKRRLAAALSIAVAAGTAAAVPAPARAATPIVVNPRDAAQPVYDVDSDASGTVYVRRDGEVRLVRGALTPASPDVSLGSRGTDEVRYVAQEVSIQDGLVAVPRVSGRDTFATTVRWCLVADCPTTKTLTAPAGYRYLGNAGDVAVLHKPATNTLALQPWAGGAARTVALGSRPQPQGAYGDADGIALWHTKYAYYVARPSLAITTLNGGIAYLTPSYVVYVRRDHTVYPNAYWVSRVPRSNPATAPAVLDDGTYDDLFLPPSRIVATDDAAAWVLPLTSRDDERDTVPEETERLFTLAYGSDKVESGRVEWDALTPLADGTFAVHRDGLAGRGFYAVTAGTTTGALVHTLPPLPARVSSLWMSADRLAYTDDSKAGGAAYVRDVDGGVPSTETPVKELADRVSLSGPFVAVSSLPNDGKGDAGAAHPYRTVAGPFGAAPRTWTSFSPGEPELSGPRLVVQSPNSLRLDDVYGSYGRTGYRGDVTGAVFGDYFVAADKNGTVLRRDLRTGARETVRAGTCGGDCGDDQAEWELWAWGQEVLYALDLGAHGRVAGLWNGATGTTTALPMLAAGWTELAYRDGLLLVHRAGDGVRLFDLHAGTNALVDATGDLPAGNGIGPRVIAWRNADGQGVVRPIGDLLPGYVSATRYLTSSVPRGVGPNLNSSDVWAAVFYLSDDSEWELDVRQGSASGPLVRTMTGSSEDETVRPAWDGKDDSGEMLPQDWYAWSLTTDAGTLTGLVYLSLDTPPTPTLNVPELTSDQSATDRFTITWDGRPDVAGYRYILDGPAGTLATTAESRTYTGKGPGTYRFGLSIEDPAGRRSALVTGVTVTPADDSIGKASSSWTRSYAGQHWKGSQLRSATAGAKVTFAVRGDGIWLVGPKAPSYGRYRVTVAGRSWTYDAYAPTVKFRQVLFKLGGLPYAVHTVTVEVLATPGRTRVGVDAVGARKPEMTGH